MNKTNTLIRQKNDHLGFTIVELLIVIVVIGILAAITIVAYNGVQARANDSAVQSDIKNIGTKIMSYPATNEGVYPSTEAHLGTLNLKPTRGSYGTHLVSGGFNYNLLYCRTAASDDFTLIGASTSGKKFIFKDGTAKEYTGTWSSGWGVICPETLAPNGTSSQGIWFYSQNNWVSWVK